MNFVETLQNLEPVFMQAGQLALKMQKGVVSHNKFDSGNPASDIVTEADFAVQEFLLGEMVKTDLVNCRLLAEEDTETTKKFNDLGEYYLAIDPIDETAKYARGEEFFSVIVSLHDGKNILYMFVYFPALEWTHKIVNNVYSATGETPDFSLIPNMQNVILYNSGEPEKNLPQELLEELKAKNITFQSFKDYHLHIGSIPLFACEKIAGFYYTNANVYDALVEYSIALAKGKRVYSGGPNCTYSLTNIKQKETGLYYEGWYLALNI